MGLPCAMAEAATQRRTSKPRANWRERLACARIMARPSCAAAAPWGCCLRYANGLDRHGQVATRAPETNAETSNTGIHADHWKRDVSGWCDSAPGLATLSRQTSTGWVGR